MARYTARNAQAAFEALADACGATILDYEWSIYDKRREGAWLLDHASTYGGYGIAAIVASSPPSEGDDRPQSYTAETHPLGAERYAAREFCGRCWFATRAIGFKP